MTDENENVEEFEIEEVDILRIQAAGEKHQRLQYTIKDLYESLQEAKKSFDEAQAKFYAKYSEMGKYEIVSVDDSTMKGTRKLKPEDESEEPEEFDVVVDEEDSSKDE